MADVSRGPTRSVAGHTLSICALAGLVALALAAACSGGAGLGESSEDEAAPPDANHVVQRVIDGDTIELEDGARVRLVQIDAPEPGEGECYGEEAAGALSAILPPGTAVTLEADPALDDVDRFGRLLRYVLSGGENVNVELVEQGAASVWFFEGDRGRYAGELLRAAAGARDAGRGLWGACPGTRFDPEQGVDAQPA